MASIFASSDIALLTAAFPPPSVTFDRPGLTRGQSGDRFFHSLVVLQGLQDHIRNSDERITLPDLCRQLQIDSKGISVEDLPDVWYSNDHRSVLPDAERRLLTNELVERVGKALVNITSYCATRRVAPSTFDSIIQKKVEQKEWRVLKDDEREKRTFVCSKAYITSIQSKIRQALDEASEKAERCNLSEAVFSEPLHPSNVDVLGLTNGILAACTEEALSASTTPQGSVVREQSDVVFVPDTFEAAQSQRLRDLQKTRAREVADVIRGDQYIILSPVEAANQMFLEEVVTQTSDLVIEQIRSPDHFTFITDGCSRQIVSEAQDGASKIATSIWRDRPDVQNIPAFTTNVKDKVSANSSKPDLLRILLSNPKYAILVEASFEKAISALEISDRSKFHNLIRTNLIIPTQLYINSLSILTDETLKSKLDAFASAHLGGELLPTALTQATHDRLLVDRSYKKELEKLQSILPRQSLADTHASISKCARKLKTDAPSPEATASSKMEILRRKTKAMKKMAKGSDVLQNLIWILLSQQAKREHGVDALFVSSGKDTSRMIKLFQGGQSDGDADAGARLQKWRDDLKAGGDGEHVRWEMAEFAARTLVS
ncbi:hypothetical protein K431DRAFT_344264 [Polychaeton citri CBS 116435]|uniref:Uncharacterized protein n=1 Tax=Polychaeton citri CBS 116435 TaxID=1314669 RepID=A0A9P4QG84_9PEZI|nr:hypothetical protein K431DRAFT_344264 [Polychaeton citri CBS 116435]